MTQNNGEGRKRKGASVREQRNEMWKVDNERRARFKKQLEAIQKKFDTLLAQSDYKRLMSLENAVTRLIRP